MGYIEFGADSVANRALGVHGSRFPSHECFLSRAEIPHPNRLLKLVAAAWGMRQGGCLGLHEDEATSGNIFEPFRTQVNSYLRIL